MLVQQLEVHPDKVAGQGTLAASQRDGTRNSWYSSTRPALIAWAARLAPTGGGALRQGVAHDFVFAPARLSSGS